MATYQDLLQQTRQQIKNIDLQEADRLRREGATLVDIREADEVEQGIVDGAVHIPRGFLESRIEQVATELLELTQGRAPFLRQPHGQGLLPGITQQEGTAFGEIDWPVDQADDPLVVECSQDFSFGL